MNDFSVAKFELILFPFQQIKQLSNTVSISLLEKILLTFRKRKFGHNQGDIDNLFYNRINVVDLDYNITGRIRVMRRA